MNESTYDPYNGRGCCVCGGLILIDDYMLRPGVWKAAGFGMGDFCHVDCLAAKLGREPKISDFWTIAPINRLLIFGYLMGRRADRSEAIPDLPPTPRSVEDETGPGPRKY